MKKKLILFIVMVFVLTGCGATNTAKDANMDNKSNKLNKLEKMNNQEEKKDTNVSSEDGAVEYKDVTVNRDDFTDLVDSNTQAVIETNLGDIKVKFYNEDARETVNNFLNLANLDFYNGIIFHRVMEDFMIQVGDPLSRNDDWSRHGTGGPGYKFEDEFNDHKLVKGSIAMANSGPNTNGSQFFIVTKEETPWLDGKHTNFGEVVEGMDIVEEIEKAEVDGRDHPLEDIVIKNIKIIK